MAKMINWLKNANFNFKKGTILLQYTDDYWDAATDPEEAFRRGWDEFNGKYEYIDKHHPALHEEFYSGHGGPEAPAIIAKDDQAIYFPTQYDGATSLEKVYIDFKHYEHNPTPYPGG